MNFSETLKHWGSPKKIFLTSHENPDGDAVGSLLALYHFFLKMDNEVHMMVPNHFPEFLEWMTGQEKILIYRKEKKKCDALMKEADVLFSLDYNSPPRIGNAEKAFSQASGIKILIDHHIDPDRETYDHIFSAVETSSTAELVYEFMKAINGNLIDQTIGEAIFEGIMTDTGSFSYNCNFKRTFKIVSELIALGVDTVKINKLVYSTYREDRLRLLGFSLSDKLVVLQKYNTAYIWLTKEELQRFNYKIGDTEGLVNYAMSIRGIRFAALFTEREKKIRISFRSEGDFSVNSFAREHFLGGGHKNAAGGDSFEPMNKTLEKFERLLSQYASELE